MQTTIYNQKTAYDSPHSLQKRFYMLIWQATWSLLCKWTPKPLNRWRLFVLRSFGASLYGTPFVHQNAKIHIPWNLIMHNKSCLGDGAVAYTQGIIEIEEEATIAQEAYLCTGTHDFSDPTLPLVTAPIKIQRNAFVGARAFIMPGVTIGVASIIGAMTVVTRDVPAGVTVVGNPGRPLQRRSSD